MYEMIIKLCIWFILSIVCNGNIIDDLSKNVVPDRYKFIKTIKIPRKLIPLTRKHMKKEVIHLHHPYKYKHIKIYEIHNVNNKHDILLGKFKSTNVAIRCDKKTCDFFEEKIKV